MPKICLLRLGKVGKPPYFQAPALIRHGLPICILNIGLVSHFGDGRYLYSVRDERWSMIGFVSELTLSISVGLCIGYYCEYSGWSKELACCLAILGGNNGGDFISKVKKIISHVIQKKLNINIEEK